VTQQDVKALTWSSDSIVVPRRAKSRQKITFRQDFKRRRLLYFMIIPGVLFYLIFNYVPMYGLIVAFQDYNPYTGISGMFSGDWVGLLWFERMFQQAQFLGILRNTVLINVYSLVWGFPVPIILAIMINEVRIRWFKMSAQTLSYLPHFLSWAIVGGFVIQLLSTNNGLVNNALMALHITSSPIPFVVEPEWFRSILVSSGIWKEVGWNSIIYLAAIAGINPQLYEAAIVDGAGKFRQIWHVTLPGILPTISICLILNLGVLMSSSFDQVYVLLTANTQSVGDVFSTFIYRVGIQNGQFSFTAAIGLFQNVVDCILVVLINWITKRLTGSGLW